MNMMNFTDDEKKTMIENVKACLKYVRTNVTPYIRTHYILKFKDDPNHYPIMFIVNPGKTGAIEFTRGYNSTEYFLGDEYDDCIIHDDRGHRQNFLKCFDEMFAFLKNWPKLKEELLLLVNRDKNIKNVLKNFTV